MALQPLRLAITNLYYYIQEIMQTNGFITSEYTITIGYPNEDELTKINTWPTIVVEAETMFGIDFELGSRQSKVIHFFIDVLAKSNGQKEDIAYFLWNSLNETYIPYYDFNTGYPTAVGDYSGITRSGSMYIDNLTANQVVPENTVVLGEKHHIIIDGFLTLAN